MATQQAIPLLTPYVGEGREQLPKSHDVWGTSVCVKRMGVRPQGEDIVTECHRYSWVSVLTATPMTLALWHCGQWQVWYRADPGSRPGGVTKKLEIDVMMWRLKTVLRIWILIWEMQRKCKEKLWNSAPPRTSPYAMSQDWHWLTGRVVTQGHHWMTGNMDGLGTSTWHSQTSWALPLLMAHCWPTESGAHSKTCLQPRGPKVLLGLCVGLCTHQCKASFLAPYRDPSEFSLGWLTTVVGGGLAVGGGGFGQNLEYIVAVKVCVYGGV